MGIVAEQNAANINDIKAAGVGAIDCAAICPVSENTQSRCEISLLT
ncbi:MAG: hypothetical protein WCD86_03285 [Ktedonobacteraceae bacterium]